MYSPSTWTLLYHTMIYCIIHYSTVHSCTYLDVLHYAVQYCTVYSVCDIVSLHFNSLSATVTLIKWNVILPTGEYSPAENIQQSLIIFQGLITLCTITVSRQGFFCLRCIPTLTVLSYTNHCKNNMSFLSKLSQMYIQL